MLHLKTFGGPSVDNDGIPATGAAQQRKTLGLLALLAAAGPRSVSRDKLIASLWPETDAEHGRGLLKQACDALRRDLHARDLFLGSIQLRLNPAVISSDVESFATALEEHDPAKAVSLYGAPFLDLRCGEAYGELVRTELGGDPPAELSHWIEQHRHVAGNGATGNGATGNGTAGNGTGLSNQLPAAHPAPAGRFTTAGEPAQPLAVDSYQFVLNAWRHADPELEPYVREARAGVERLSAD